MAVGPRPTSCVEVGVECYSIAMLRRRGRILAVKWGMNPNSSSLGVDVTFLLFGAVALAIATPVLGAVLRWRSNKPAIVEEREGSKGV